MLKEMLKQAGLHSVELKAFFGLVILDKSVILRYKSKC